jgi:phosphoserine phosphatase
LHHSLAVVFDFDDTLVPDSTTLFLQSRGVDTERFWGVQAKELIQRGYDPALAFLRLFLDNVGLGKQLGELKNADLRAFGKRLDKTFYPGIPGLFKDLKATVAKYHNISIDFYIISGGLREMLAGSSVVSKNFKGVYGCQLEEDSTSGHLRHIMRCVTFTEKTRYLFEINKGLSQADASTNPYLVNKPVEDRLREVPISNMIYVGDGLTDVPCFSLVQRNGGMAFGVFDPSIERSAKKALTEFLRPKRVTSLHAPRYRRTDELGALLRAAVATRCADMSLSDKQA